MCCCFFDVIMMVLCFDDLDCDVKEWIDVNGCVYCVFCFWVLSGMFEADLWKYGMGDGVYNFVVC